ncbi:MAG: hypothetical protein ACI4JX_07045 [Oscillospiraceae bacterium]
MKSINDNENIIDDILNEVENGFTDSDMQEDIIYVDEVSDEDLGSGDEAEEIQESDDDGSEQKKSAGALVATVLTVLLALGAALAFLIAYSSGVFTRDESRYDADITVQQEVMENAQTLINNNYEIIMMFYEYGLSHEAPDVYGAEHQGNAYPVTDSEFTSLASIEELVNSTLVKDEADKILQNAQGMGAIYTEQDGKLVMNIDRFVPLDYDRNWDSTQITCDYISDDSARVVVALSTKEHGVPITVSGSMVRTEDGSWKLKKLIY